MRLDDLLLRYFGTTELAAVGKGAMGAGLERARVDLGLTQDAGQRFALWCLLHMLGDAPDLDIAFAEESDRDAARNFIDLLNTQN